MTLHCPTCHRETGWDHNPWRPFCSERCCLIDLGDWASERYRLPGKDLLTGADEAPGLDEEA